MNKIQTELKNEWNGVKNPHVLLRRLCEISVLMSTMALPQSFPTDIFVTSVAQENNVWSMDGYKRKGEFIVNDKARIEISKESISE